MVESARRRTQEVLTNFSLRLETIFRNVPFYLASHVNFKAFNVPKYTLVEVLCVLLQNLLGFIYQF